MYTHTTPQCNANTRQIVAMLEMFCTGKKKKKKNTEKLGSVKVWLEEETNKKENTIDASKRNDSIITELDPLRKL